MICTKCNFQNDAAASFCTNCGAKLVAPQPKVATAKRQDIAVPNNKSNTRKQHISELTFSVLNTFSGMRGIGRWILPILNVCYGIFVVIVILLVLTDCRHTNASYVRHGEMSYETTFDEFLRGYITIGFDGLLLIGGFSIFLGIGISVSGLLGKSSTNAKKALVISLVMLLFFVIMYFYYIENLKYLPVYVLH
jgi:Ca2+/Na+ antiporter